MSLQLGAQAPGPTAPEPWSLAVRFFATGERLAVWPGSPPAGARGGEHSSPSHGKDAGAFSPQAVLVVVTPGAATDRVVVSRGPPVAPGGVRRLLVWLPCAERPAFALPSDPGDAAASPAPGAALVGPGSLLSFEVPPEVVAKVSSAMRSSDRVSCRPGLMTDLCERYVLTLAGTGQLPAGTASAELIGRQVADLVRAALDPQTSRPERSGEAVPDRRLSRVLAVIQARCTDPDLTPGDVAARAQISVRYVHRLLQIAGTKFGEELIRARLDLAHAILSRPRSRKIIDVAVDCGFKDVTHFSRRYKARFGISPRDAGARGEGAREDPSAAER